MKTSFRTKLAGIVINISCIIIIIGYASTIKLPVKIKSWEYTNLPIDTLKLADSLPYKTFVALRDSILTMRKLQNGIGFDHDNGQFAYLGTQVSIACDTCSLTWYRNNLQTYNQNYIKLHAWGIKKQYPHIKGDGKFFIKNKQAYVRQAVPYKNSDTKFDLVDMPVKFKYNVEDNAMLIPVDARTASAFETTFMVLWGITIIGMLYLSYISIRFLIDTARGRPFTQQNVARLGLLAVCFSVYPVLVIIVNVLVKYIFKAYFSAEIALKDEVWKTSFSLVLNGVILSLIWGAFYRARKLQEEQDLTV